MKKSLLAATAALLSVAAFAGTPLKDLKSVPAEVFLPEKVTFVEGEDDGDGAVDVIVATDAKVADIVSFLQAKAKEQGLQAVSEEVNEEDAKLEYSKVGADNNGEYKVGWCPKMYAASNKSVVDIEKSDGKCLNVIEHLLGKTAGFTHRTAYPLA